MDNIERILKRYPDRIPVILIPLNKDIGLKKYKYLVHPTIKIGHFIYTLLLNNNLKSSSGIYLTTQKGNMISTQDTFEYLYHNFKSNDEALYLNVIKENVFG